MGFHVTTITTSGLRAYLQYYLDLQGPSRIYTGKVSEHIFLSVSVKSFQDCCLKPAAKQVHAFLRLIV